MRISGRPRKIVFLTSLTGYSWGGSEYLWAAAAERLARSGVQVHVSLERWKQPVRQVEKLRAVGCRIFYRTIPSLPVRAIRRLTPWRDYARRHMKKIAAGADLVVLSQGSNFEALHWMEAAHANGYPYAIISQSAVVYWWPNDDSAQQLAESYGRASAAYFVSQAILNLSCYQFGALRNPRVVRNPFNVPYDVSSPWPASKGLALACVGRLDIISKAQDILFQALALPHWRNREVSVSLVGDGPHERGLRRMAGQLGLSNVVFSGQSSNVQEVWTTNHALVLPSRYEGMPLVLVEAMLCGRPAIITDVGGVRELLRDNVNGFLAKAPTVELLDEAMNRAWENRHRLREMGEQAAIDVRKFVGPDPTGDFVRELLRLIESPATVAQPASAQPEEARS